MKPTIFKDAIGYIAVWPDGRKSDLLDAVPYPKWQIAAGRKINVLQFRRYFHDCREFTPAESSVFLRTYPHPSLSKLNHSSSVGIKMPTVFKDNHSCSYFAIFPNGRMDSLGFYENTWSIGNLNMRITVPNYILLYPEDKLLPNTEVTELFRDYPHPLISKSGRQKLTDKKCIEWLIENTVIYLKTPTCTHHLLSTRRDIDSAMRKFQKN
jgi:hypothetical protein